MNHEAHAIRPTRYVVGVSGMPSSETTLRWARDYIPPTAEILVVHATSVPITVRNGPSAAVARKLDNPIWATIASRAKTALGTRRHDVLVDQGNVFDVLCEHARSGDVLVIGDVRGPLHRRSVIRQLRRRTTASAIAIGVDGMSVLTGIDPLPEVDGSHRPTVKESVIELPNSVSDRSTRPPVPS